MSQVAGAYPGFCSMKRLGILPLPPGLDASPSQGYPSIKFAGTHLYTWVERGTVRVKCLAHEHNAVSPARSRTRTARSGVDRTNHEATAPPNVQPASQAFRWGLGAKKDRGTRFSVFFPHEKWGEGQKTKEGGGGGLVSCKISVLSNFIEVISSDSELETTFLQTLTPKLIDLSNKTVSKYL